MRVFSNREKWSPPVVYSPCFWVCCSFFGNTFHCIRFASIRFPRVALMLLCDKTFPDKLICYLCCQCYRFSNDNLFFYRHFLSTLSFLTVQCFPLNPIIVFSSFNAPKMSALFFFEEIFFLGFLWFCYYFANINITALRYSKSACVCVCVLIFQSFYIVNFYHEQI